MRTYYVYILANKKNGTLYTGITNDLIRRVFEHKTKLTKGFTSKYNIDKLVYFEDHNEVSLAIQREKRIKEWPRRLKLCLIEGNNPEWQDLYEEII